jgi:hypothetical protein
VFAGLRADDTQEDWEAEAGPSLVRTRR